jgi:uroporphyrin-III C-methyltransferase
MASSNPSLLTATNATGHVHLLIALPTPASLAIASSRATRSLEVGAKPILICPPAPSRSPSSDPEAFQPLAQSTFPYNSGLESRIQNGELRHLTRAFTDHDLFSIFGRPDNGGYVDAVFVCFSARTSPLAAEISAICRKHRVPVNVLDSSSLCSFSLLSTHTEGVLQIGVTTNGSGCALSGRIRREVVGALPKDLGGACARLGAARRRIIAEDRQAAAEAQAQAETDATVEVEDGEEALNRNAQFNRLVLERDESARKDRRIRWLSQVCEYWPLEKLAGLGEGDVERLMDAYHSLPAVPLPSVSPFTETAVPASNRPSTDNAVVPAPPKRGIIILAGSGPGHPDLLTRATHKAILSADIILADKLVPAGVLALIPRRTPLHIARKFPGNAERAQEELLSLALAGLKEGKTVLRLKQGDPYLYGRGGEEVAFFESHGYGERIRVLPGVTSALSAPLFAGIPVTNRGVADQVLVCTGTGRAGARLPPPEYVESRTVVFLMALHRIADLVEDLTSYVPEMSSTPGGQGVRGSRVLYPASTPCAVIERASCPDQRVIRTTLAHVVAAIEEEGSRPPGLLVVGKACETLWTPESGKKWTTEEGFRGMDFGNDLKLDELLEQWAGEQPQTILEASAVGEGGNADDVQVPVTLREVVDSEMLAKESMASITEMSTA